MRSAYQSFLYFKIILTMKKNLLRLFACALLFSACKHEPIIPDTEYLSSAARQKIADYQLSDVVSVNNILGISIGKDNAGQNAFVISAHINHNHTLDALSVHKSDWALLPQHFGNSTAKTLLSNTVDQTVNFQIRSKTPQNEVTNGSVLIPQSTPISATTLSENTFKLQWTPQYPKEKVLIYFTYFTGYGQTRINDAYALETADDGECILPASLWAQFKRIPNAFTPNLTSENVSINLIRFNPKRKTSVTQVSTGTQYTVYGDNYGVADIEVLIK